MSPTKAKPLEELLVEVDWKAGLLEGAQVAVSTPAANPANAAKAFFVVRDSAREMARRLRAVAKRSEEMKGKLKAAFCNSDNPEKCTDLSCPCFYTEACFQGIARALAGE